MINLQQVKNTLRGKERVENAFGVGMIFLLLGGLGANWLPKESVMLWVMLMFMASGICFWRCAFNGQPKRWVSYALRAFAVLFFITSAECIWAYTLDAAE